MRTVLISLSLLSALGASGCRLGYDKVGEGLVASTAGAGAAGAPADSETTSISMGGIGGTGGSSGAGGQGGTLSSGGATSSNSGGAGGAAAAGGSTGGTSGSGGVTAGGAGGTGGATATTAGGGAASSVGGTGGAPPVVGPYCERLPRLASTPVIDGMLDGNLPLEDLPKSAWRIPADNPPEFSSLPTDVSLRFMAAWFDAGLYFYAEIVDPDRYPAVASADEWQGDGVDIYVDHDAVFASPGFYDDPGTRSLTVAAPVDDTTTSTRAGIFMPFIVVGKWNSGEAMAVPTTDGYRVEAMVTAATLGLSSWSLAPGSAVAFDLAHGVSFPSGETGSEGRRLGHYFLKAAASGNGDLAGYPFYDSSVYCVPVLEGP